jgi:hypothetical protein
VGHCSDFFFFYFLSKFYVLICTLFTEDPLPWRLCRILAFEGFGEFYPEVFSVKKCL